MLEEAKPQKKKNILSSILNKFKATQKFWSTLLKASRQFLSIGHSYWLKLQHAQSNSLTRKRKFVLLMWMHSHLPAIYDIYSHAIVHSSNVFPLKTLVIIFDHILGHTMASSKLSCIFCYCLLISQSVSRYVMWSHRMYWFYLGEFF